MTSAAKAVANRQNAQLSTGPRTEEGKAASSRNSVRHGLTGTQIVMPGEDAAAYEEMRQGMQDSYCPANEPERALVDQIAANYWRLLRAQRVETAFLAKLAEGSEDPSLAIAAAFLERPKDLDRIQRYVTAASNAFYKAMKELEKMQRERAAVEHQEAIEEAYLERASERAAAKSGFVSKSAPSSDITSPAASTPSHLTAAAPLSRSVSSGNEFAAA
jgi:hypothetical protein